MANETEQNWRTISCILYSYVFFSQIFKVYYYQNSLFIVQVQNSKENIFKIKFC